MPTVYPMGQVYEGERQVVGILRDCLPDEFVIFHNVTLLLPEGRYSFEYDLILVGNAAIYVIEVKLYYGRIHVRESDGSWVLASGSRIRDPLAMTQGLANLLSNYLRNQLPLLENLEVVPLVILAGEREKSSLAGIPRDIRRVTHMQDAPALILRLEEELRVTSAVPPDLKDLICQAILNASSLRLLSYESPTLEGEVTDRPLDPGYLRTVVVPYLEALEELFQIVDRAMNVESHPLRIYEIVQRSPLSLSFDGVASAIKLTLEVIVPWRRRHAQEMARLLELEKQTDIEVKRAEAIEKRSQAKRERAEAQRLATQAGKESLELERTALENERLRLEQRLLEERYLLALEVLEALEVEFGPDEERRDRYARQLQGPLEKLVSSELSMPRS